MRLTTGAIAVGSLALLTTALGACNGSEPLAPPPLEIPIVEVAKRDVAIPLEVVGETIGSVDVTIRARVEGFLDGIHFQEGTFVEADTLLYTIDPRPFETKVVGAQGILAEARTALAKATSDLDRIRPLAEMNAVSAQDLDSAVAQYEAARSAVQVGEAQVELAEIELGYTRISTPVGGLIGLSNSEVGDFVGKSTDSLLNVVSRTHPIAVRSSITERSYLTAVRRLAKRNESVAPGSNNLTLILADGTVYEHAGRVTKIDRNIDTRTGALTVEAEFPNPDELLRPGMFARIKFDAQPRPGAILVPQRAVNELQGNFRLFIIAPDDTVEIRPVEVGPKLGSDWIIETGVEPGERVAVEGLLRMRPGMTVAPHPYAGAAGDS